METFLAIIIFIFIAFLLSFLVNRQKIYRGSKNTKKLSESRRDENIRLQETVGRFAKGDKHYCYECDTVCIHLEEKFLGETFGFFEILNFFLPWKWAFVATIFKFWDKQYQTVCTNCYPDFYEDWKLLKRKKRKQNLISFFAFMMIIFFLYLYLKN